MPHRFLRWHAFQIALFVECENRALPSQGISVFTNPPREYLEQLLLRTGKLRERDLTLEKIAMELIRKSSRTIRRAQLVGD